MCMSKCFNHLGKMKEKDAQMELEKTLSLTTIPVERWKPFFWAWVDNWTLNFGANHFTNEQKPHGRVARAFKEHFTGFYLDNPQHRLSWDYVTLRATIDYCNANNISWKLNPYKSMSLQNYKVCFRYEPKNILAVNERIYRNNSVPFPKNAHEVFMDGDKPQY